MKILVSSIKQRDVDHFEMVYNYYMPVLYRFAMQYAYDSETAKDLVHDAFAWVWNNPDKIRDDGNVAALLYRLVRSNCLNISGRSIFGTATTGSMPKPQHLPNSCSTTSRMMTVMPLNCVCGML